uniref:hypothetical protein n=1 Tax=Candidatus Fimivicinus sp. TaxID=3056640 RepID=UPI003FEEFBB9
MKFGLTEMFRLPAPAERNGRSYAYAGAASPASHWIRMENGPAAVGISNRGGWSSGTFRRLPCAEVLRRILPRLWHDACPPVSYKIGFSVGPCLSSAGLRTGACCVLYFFREALPFSLSRKAETVILAAFLLALVLVYGYRMFISHTAVLEADFSSSVLYQIISFLKKPGGAVLPCLAMLWPDKG